MTATLVPFEEAVDDITVAGMRGGSGPPALLLHGTGGSWRNFRPWLDTLVPRCDAVIPDLPGFGRSPAPALAPSLAAWADLLHALAARLGVSPRLVVGLGLGASLALSYLERHRADLPELAALVLHTPPYYPGAFRPATRIALKIVTGPGVLDLIGAVFGERRAIDWYVGHFIEGPEISAQEAADLREDFRRASLPVLRGLLRDALRADFRPMLAQLPIPTLALISQRDPFVDASEVERLGILMPRATVVVQPDIAHGWTPEAIAEQNRQIGHFLDGALGTDPQRQSPSVADDTSPSMRPLGSA